MQEHLNRFLRQQYFYTDVKNNVMNKNLFRVTKLSLPGVVLIEPQLRNDERGFSAMMYHVDELAALGITTRFVQDYISYSKKDVIRGLHYQRALHAQDKLIRCATGRVLDIVADYNSISKNFGTHIKVEIDTKKGEMLYVPGNYAHGFCVLSDEGALVEYKLSDYYHPECAAGVRYDDPVFDIKWPVNNPVLSLQDKTWPLLPLTQL